MPTRSTATNTENPKPPPSEANVIQDRLLPATDVGPSNPEGFHSVGKPRNISAGATNKGTMTDAAVGEAGVASRCEPEAVPSALRCQHLCPSRLKRLVYKPPPGSSTSEESRDGENEPIGSPSCMRCGRNNVSMYVYDDFKKIQNNAPSNQAVHQRSFIVQPDRQSNPVQQPNPAPQPVHQYASVPQPVQHFAHVLQQPREPLHHSRDDVQMSGVPPIRGPTTQFMNPEVCMRCCFQQVPQATGNHMTARRANMPAPPQMIAPGVQNIWHPNSPLLETCERCCSPKATDLPPVKGNKYLVLDQDKGEVQEWMLERSEPYIPLHTQQVEAPERSQLQPRNPPVSGQRPKVTGSTDQRIGGPPTVGQATRAKEQNTMNRVVLVKTLDPLSLSQRGATNRPEPMGSAGPQVLIQMADEPYVELSPPRERRVREWVEEAALRHLQSIARREILSPVPDYEPLQNTEKYEEMIRKMKSTKPNARGGGPQAVSAEVIQQESQPPKSNQQVSSKRDVSPRLGQFVGTDKLRDLESKIPNVREEGWQPMSSEARQQTSHLSMLSVSDEELQVLLERDLSPRLKQHIDEAKLLYFETYGPNASEEGSQTVPPGAGQQMSQSPKSFKPDEEDPSPVLQAMIESAMLAYMELKRAEALGKGPQPVPPEAGQQMRHPLKSSKAAEEALPEGDVPSPLEQVAEEAAISFLMNTSGGG